MQSYGKKFDIKIILLSNDRLRARKRDKKA